MDQAERKSILLVEDEAIIALSEKRILENFGYSILVAPTGEAAIDLVHRTPTIDLVLMDINLGQGIDGTAAAERILAIRDLPIVFLSSHAEPDIVKRTERITSYGYVVKNSSGTVIDASIKMAFKLFAANERIREVKDRLEATLDAMPDLLFEIGLDGTYLDIHAPHAELLFRPAADMIGKNIYEVIPAQAADVIMAAVREADECGYSVGARYQLEVPAGACWFEMSVSRLPGSADDPSFIFLSRDITSRKRAEEALLESETRLARAEKNARIGNWKLVLDTGMMTFSTGARLIYGVEEGWLPFERIKAIPLPEYRAELDAAVSALIAGASAYDVEFKIRRQTDGAVLDIHSMAEYDERNRVLFGIIEDVTARRRADEALRESENRYRSLFENAPIGVIYSTMDGNVIRVNEEYARLLGYDSADEISRAIDESSAARVLFDREEDREELIRIARASPGSWVRREQRYKKKDGSFIIARLVFRSIPESPEVIEGFVEDISERKRLEAELLEAKERAERNSRRFTMVAANMPGYIAFIDKDSLRYEYANRAYSESLGIPPERVVGSTVAEVIGEDKFAFARSFIEEARAGRTASYVNTFETVAGTRWLKVNYVPIKDDDGGIATIMILSYDISEQKQAEADFLKLLEEKELILKEVHHRIKNNLNTIVSLLGLQAGTVDEPAAVEALEDASARVRSMMVLYDKLYRSIGSGALPLATYLDALVDEIVGNFPNADTVSVEKDLEEIGLDARLMQPLGIIVNELLTNIMKYAFAGRSSGRVKVAAASEGGRVRLTIEDDGNGMPESVDFERSTGFGLQLVGMLTKQMRGTIRIERGRGTRIVLEFEAGGPPAQNAKATPKKW